MKKNLLLTIFAFCFITLGYSQADCANALVLTPGTPQVGDTTGQAGSFSDTNTAPEVNPCSTYYNDLEYWFQYTAVETGETLDITISDLTTNWYGVFVIDNCPDSTPNCIASDTNSTSMADLAVTTPALTAGTVYYIVITDWAEGSTTFTLNSTVNPVPSCLTPTDLTATGITDSSADLAWTEAGTATVWNIEIVDSGNTATGTATATGVSNPYTAMSLAENSAYEFYVQADCGMTDGVSEWAGPFTFSTICSSIAPDYLADMSSNAPDCWEEANSGDAESGPMDLGAGLWYASNHNGTPSNAINMWSDVRSDWIISPIFDLSAAAPSELKIYVALTESSNSGADADLGSDDYIELLMTTDGGATWTSMQSWTQGNVPTDVGEEITYDLSAITGNVQFAFLGDEGDVNDTEDVYFHVSKFQVRETPACIEPSDLTADNITTNSADFGWTENGTATIWNVEVVVAGTAPTGTATDSNVANPFSKTGLMSGTTYEFYVQSDCGGDVSAWTGPFAFSTDCASYTAPYMENFDGVSSSEVPTCWSTIVNSTSEYATVLTNTTQAVSDPNSMRFYNSGDIEAELILVSPNFSDDFTLNRVRFSARDADENSLIVGTMTDPTDASTFTTFQTITLTSTHTEYSVSFDTYTGTDEYVALKMVPGATYDYTYIDDFNWEAIPSCLEPSDLVLTGFTSTSADIAWTIGDSETLWDIELVDITNGETVTGTATSTDVTNPYTIESLTANTEYEVYVRANCGDSYSPWVGPLSFFTGYCSSVPSSNDGDGISNLQVGSVDFASGGDITYEDFTGTPVDLAAGINSNVQITFTTGYTYGTNIWIDFDDDLVFDASDLVYTGESTSANPTTLDASFIMPAGAALGQHRMRIVTDDSTSDATNPCNSSTYGVTMDVDITIVEASCAPAEATASIVSDCANNQFSIDVDVTALGDGTPELYDGTNTYAVSSLGVITVGPYTSGTTVDLDILHGTDNTCDLFLGTYVYDCPPINDSCTNAIMLTAGSVFGDNAIVGTNNGATASGELPLPGCASYDPEDITGNGGDVWYAVTIPADGNLTIETSANPIGNGGDSGMAIYSGSCGSLVLVECDDDDSPDGAYSQVIIDAADDLAGQVVYARVWEYGGNALLDFQISAYSATLSVGNFENETAFTYFPNPVKNTLTLNAQNTIEQVSMYNMLGQEVLRATPNTIDSELDMSQLQTGAYFVKVTIANITQTIRVIKQ